MSYRTFSALVFLVASSQAGCGDHPSEVQVSPAIVRPTPPPGIRNAKIPASVTYRIIKDEHIKFPERDTRYVDFRLNQKVSEDVLREIARAVMAKEPYRRTVSFYYLPETVSPVLDRPWASTDYRPKLEVRILGLTIEDEAMLRGLKIETAGDKIGSWLVEFQSGSHVAIIYEDNGPKLAMVYPGKNRINSPLVELPAAIGRRFQVHGSTEFHEIDTAGVLRLVAADGRIFAGGLPLE